MNVFEMARRYIEEVNEAEEASAWEGGEEVSPGMLELRDFAESVLADLGPGFSKTS
jgi:hypothetical protein